MNQAEHDLLVLRAQDGSRAALEALVRLHLFYVCGMTVAEIAVVQDLPPGTVKSRLHRAREQLKRQLGDRDDESG